MKVVKIAIALLLCSSVAFAGCGNCDGDGKKCDAKKAHYKKMLDDRIATLDVTPKQAEALKKATRKHHKAVKKAEKNYRKKIHRILKDDKKADAFLKKPCPKGKDCKDKKDCKSCKVKPAEKK